MEKEKRVYSHYTVEEKFKFIEEFYQSQISLTRYCRIKELNKSSFYKWLKLYEEAVGTPTRDTQGSFINISNDVRDTMNNLPAKSQSNIVASPGVIQASNSIIDSPSIEPVLQRDEILLSVGKISIKCNFSILDKVLEKLQ